MKHGIILNDDFFSFCAKKIITENGRYSLLQFLNSNEMYEEKYFFVETGLPYLIKTANKLFNFFNSFIIFIFTSNVRIIIKNTNIKKITKSF